jgi:hypothetical protein
VVHGAPQLGAAASEVGGGDARGGPPRVDGPARDRGGAAAKAAGGHADAAAVHRIHVTAVAPPAAAGGVAVEAAASELQGGALGAELAYKGDGYLRAGGGRETADGAGGRDMLRAWMRAPSCKSSRAGSVQHGNAERSQLSSEVQVVWQALRASRKTDRKTDRKTGRKTGIPEHALRDKQGSQLRRDSSPLTAASCRGVPLEHGLKDGQQAGRGGALDTQ